ncbi:MAG: FeoA family protein [Kiritimatiellae bacterium]|nr:FeoA family protein [Kiritimatiellia bacterium]MDD4025098.1 FeoA family protein [Kiritimatiellia bacterium]MDD4621618.1 FeoA family protein [Kiritimatiellia bacterium]
MNPQKKPSALTDAQFLAELKDGARGVIASNPDRKSAEMGLFPGAVVTMFRNRKNERSLVIGAGDARFLISRTIARQILVSPSNFRVQQ